jgi:hypothetical protein
MYTVLGERCMMADMTNQVVDGERGHTPAA